MTLHIDTAAAAVKPADSELAGWAGEQRVFISSVMATLTEERTAVAGAVARLGAEPVRFEDLGGRDEDPQAAYLAEVARSTIYLGILSREYGRLLPSRLSATHEEYREAEDRGLRISVWVHASEEFQGDQLRFVEEVRQFHTTGSFTTAEDLADRVAARLTRMAAEDLSPWCKLGDTVFRAQRIADTGRTLTVHATIADPTVAAAVEALRPGAWAGNRECRLTYAGRSHAVRVKGVATTTTNGRTTNVEITLERASDLEPIGLTFSVSLNGYSADEVTEFGLRRALFGQRPPRTLLALGGDIGDPLAQMPTTPLSVDLHRPVLGLLVTEALIGSGRATRVTRLHVSPPGPQGRRILVEWTGRGDRSAAPRTVDGYLSA